MQITLKAGDNTKFPVTERILFKSNLFENMLKDLDVGQDDEEFEIPVPNITGPILKQSMFLEVKLVLDYAKMHDDNLEAIKGNEELLQDAEVTFLKMPVLDLVAVILGANYLDYPRLLKICIKMID